jgi:hypothetical protein
MKNKYSNIPRQTQGVISLCLGKRKGKEVWPMYGLTRLACSAQLGLKD